MNEIHENELIEGNPSFILGEMETQPVLARHYPPDVLPYEEHMAQIREFIVGAGEYGLAYEYISGALGSLPFKVSATQQ
jgi:hypothetical protein